MMTRRLQVLDYLPKLALLCLFWLGLSDLSSHAQVGPPPTITVQPLSQTVPLNGSVTFEVVASSPTTMTYQWRRNSANIPGATQSTYTIAPVSQSSAANYSVRVSNAGGTVASSNATLTVITPPTITTQPLSQTVAQGQDVTFLVAASGTGPFHYQWSFNSAPLPDATNASLTLASVGLTEMGSYTVTVRNLAGGAISAPAWLNVEAVGPVIVVSNTGDSGLGSFRQALLSANANPGPHAIVFNIPGPGPFIIKVPSPLPPITEPATIDATTQPGFLGRPIVELDGSGGVGDGLYVTSGGCTIKGLAIHDFSGSGIVLAWGASNVVQGNFIGAAADGVTKRANAVHGLVVSNSAWNVIGGTDALTRNVIVTSGRNGIHIEGPAASHNQVLGNIVGMDWTGTVKIGVRGSGIVVSNAPSNVIGGTAPGAGNLSAWNWFDGLVIAGNSACFNLVQGNLVGTDITGMVGAGSSGNGITIRDAPSNTVGGLAFEAANVIAHHSGSGVAIKGNAAQFNVIQGNFIGTDRSGTISMPNWLGGVNCSGTVNNTVGGLTAKAGNTIAFNRLGGVVVDGGQCAVRGNSLHSNAGDEIGLLNGGNNNTLPPLLTDATNHLNTTWIRGGFISAPAAIIRVEFFCSPTAAKDAKSFLGAISVTTDNTGTGPIDTVLDTGSIAGQYVTATITDEKGNTSPLSVAIPVTFDSPPLITTQPQSVIGVAGTSASLTVVATGKPSPTYQWYFQGILLANATNADLAFNALAPADAGDYVVLVANSAGSATSAVATVAVLVPPAITVQPQSQSVAPNQAVTLSVTATGTSPLSYQWTFNGAPLPMSNDALLNLQNVQLSDAGEYRVIISNAAGSITSDPAMLAVSVVPVLTPLYLSSARMTSTGFSFELSATAGLTYVILASTNCQDWTPISTNLATTANVVFTDAEAVNHPVRFYRAMVQ